MSILNQACDVLKSTPDLCDHCLGRMFAKVGQEIDNDERGRALRLALEKGMDQPENENDEVFITNLTNSDEVQKLKGAENGPDQTCSLCNNIFTELDHFVDIVVNKLDNYEYNHFLIGVRIDVEISESEEKLWSDQDLTKMEPIKTELKREIGKRVQDRTGIPPNFDNPDIVAVVDTRYDNVELQVSSLYLYGRYRKFARGIPQTKWPCKVCWGKGCPRCKNSGKMYPTSVEEIIVKEILDTAREHHHKFHGMGREDIDARMLGNGRPFIMEITAPKRRMLDLMTLQQRVNDVTAGKIEIEGIRRHSNS